MQDSTSFSSAPYIEDYDIPGGLEQALYLYYLNRPLLSKNLKWCNDYFSYKAGSTSTEYKTKEHVNGGNIELLQIFYCVTLAAYRKIDIAWQRPN